MRIVTVRAAKFVVSWLYGGLVGYIVSMTRALYSINSYNVHTVTWYRRAVAPI
jgi:hypothetical protein